jgi:4-amino-4-deoxy-L-arabinose transferase-like glycosyltransferase
MSREARTVRKAFYSLQPLQTVVEKDCHSEEKLIHLRTRDLGALATLLLLFITLGIVYSHYTPLWNPPDEERHFAYGQYIARHHKLPPLHYDTEKTNTTQAIHPPLYYLFASLFYGDETEPIQEQLLVSDGPGYRTIRLMPGESGISPQRTALTARQLRMFSLVASAAHITFLYLLVIALFPGETLLAFTTALFVAMNAQFLHISASVSNEPLTDALSTIYIFMLLSLTRGTPLIKHYLLTGAVLGCCLLSKLSTLYYLPVTAFILTWIHFRNPRKLTESFTLVAGTAFLVAGWWYLRNWLIFNDPFATAYLIASQPWGFRTTPFSASYLLSLASNTFLSFFGNFGAQQFSILKGHAAAYGVIVALGLAGLCRLVTTGKIKKQQSQAVSILLLSFLGCCALFVSMNITYVGVSMGRYLFVAIAPLAAGIVAGIWALFPLQRRNGLMLLLALLLVGLNLDILFRVIRPAYAETYLIPGIEQPLFSHPTVALNESTVLAQTFTASRNNLAAVRVMFSSLKKQRHGSIIFSLMERDDGGTVIRRAGLPLREIDDNARYCFIFPPVEYSKGKDYLFRISASSLPAGSGIALWQDREDRYPDGELLVNDTPASGDLYFSAYYFTGNHSSTDWQGKREVVIRQGSYVDIREMQLYFEQSRDFRERTVTHQKILRVQKALKNRESLL